MIRNNDAGWGGPEFRGTCFETWNMKLHGTLSKKEGNLQGLLNGLPTKDLLLDIADRSTFHKQFKSSFIPGTIKNWNKFSSSLTSDKASEACH